MSQWLIFALLSGILANGTSIINRYGLKNQGDATAYAWWFETLRTLIFLCLLPFDFAFHYSPKNILILLLLGSIEVVSVYVYMKMFAYSQLSVSTIISRLRLIFTPLFAGFFLGEVLSPSQYFGILFIFLGALATASIKQLRLDPGIKYSFGFAILSGLLAITMKAATAAGSASLITIAMAFPSILILPMLMKNPLSRLKASFQTKSKYSLSSTFFNVAFMYFALEAMRLAPVGPAFAVSNSMAVVAVLVGIIWLKETDHIPQKLLGTAASLAGIILLA